MNGFEVFDALYYDCMFVTVAIMIFVFAFAME